MVIKARFESVADMESAFAQGPSYTNVWYGEYVIIDTPNKNDKENGLIYRRGLNFNDGHGGAIRVGQIVGPSSGTPYFQMLNLESVKQEKKDAQTDGVTSYLRFPVDKDGDGMADAKTDESGNAIPGVETSDTPSDEIGLLEFNHIVDSSRALPKEYRPTTNTSPLVPGKYSEDNGDPAYNDSIKYTWVNVRKDNADEDSWFYVGFEIPYLVHEFETHKVSPYTEGKIDDNTSIDEVDANEHPFYQKWDIGIPKGVKGDTVRNIRVVALSGEYKGKIYTQDAIAVNTDGSGKVDFKDKYTYDFEEADYGKQIYVYDFYWYDNLESPTLSENDARIIYIADYADIRDIQMDDDGTVIVYYTNNTSKTFGQYMRYVEQADLDTSTGHFSITMNNDGSHHKKDEDHPDGIEDAKEVYEWDLDWIKDISLSDAGVVAAEHTYEDFQGEQDKLKDADGEYLEKWYNKNTEYLNTINWIKSITFNADTGKFDMVTNNGNIEDIDTTLPYFTEADISNTGIITFGNVDSSNTVQLTDSTNPDGLFHLKWIDNVSLPQLASVSDKTTYNNYLKTDKHISVTYNYNGGNENKTVNIGEPINFIQDMGVRPSDHHLLVLYSDPSSRGDVDNPVNSSYKANGKLWTNDTTGVPVSTANTNNTVYWRDFGSIKDDSGIMVGTRLLASENTDVAIPDNPEKVIAYLNKKYPKGLVRTDVKDSSLVDGDVSSVDGKIVVWVNDTGSDQQTFFYAFDYDFKTDSLGELVVDSDNKYAYKGWFYLGTFGAATVTAVALATSSTDVDKKFNEDISTGGIVFVTNAHEANASLGVSDFWSSIYSTKTA